MTKYHNKNGVKCAILLAALVTAMTSSAAIDSNTAWQTEDSYSHAHKTVRFH